MIRDIMKYSEKISNRLNNLLEKTYDAEKGYKLGAEKVENPSIKRFLENKNRTNVIILDTNLNPKF